MNSTGFLTVCLNPTLQRTLLFDDFRIGAVNRALTCHEDASGKGINVTRVLVQLGATVVHLTHLGREARKFLRLLTDDKIPVEWVDVGSGLRTCVTVLNKADHSTTELVEPSETVPDGTDERLMNAFRPLIFQSNWLILSGTKAPGYPDTLFPVMVRMAKDLGKKVVCDYRGDDLKRTLPEKPDFIKPNRAEFLETFFPEGFGNLDPERVLEKKMLEISEQYETTVIVTDGDGPVLFTEKGRLKRIHPDRVIPVSTIGCGDAFTAGLSWSLSLGDSLADAVRMGIRCGMRCALSIRPGVIQ